MGKVADQIIKEYRRKIWDIPYTYCHYKKFDYKIFRYIRYIKAAGMGRNLSYNDVIIMADTETSKKKPDIYDPEADPHYQTDANHVVVWTISLRAYGKNICTLWGRKPSKMIETLIRIHEHMSGLYTVVYFHNLSYDHIFLRKFAYKYMGVPIHQLNVKSLYPIYIEYGNGIIIKDSLILAQRKLEKWAVDLEVEHKKAVGKWDYDKIRNQDTPLDANEMEYIENDTLAGVECIDKTLEALGKNISSIPMTATGIPREQTRKRGRRAAHEFFQKIALTLAQYKKFVQIFHGGYTHGNRHYINTLITPDLFGDNVICRDFVSSYPYILCAFKFPMEKFTPIENCGKKFILDNKEDYAFAFKFIATNIRLKDDKEPMPALQFSKAVKTVNAILDNGRILAANYVEIYLSEWDLAVIDEQYTMDKHICIDVEMAEKGYLPRWFTDFVFESFINKTMLKGGDAVLYSIAKALVNCLYGMCAQKSLKDDIIENYLTGEFETKDIENEPEKYEEYLNKMSSILPYQWGVWVTSAAFYNVHQLAKCCRLPLYMDTDSCYGIGWDMEKVEAYNQRCKDMLQANGYGPVLRDGREYWLGVAESEGDKDVYTEFKYMGAKRYCGRCKKDGELHTTVAGVPKIGAKCLKDDIANFHPGFVFDGKETGKKSHMYFLTDEIYIDANGNETGDSISLIPCDYELDATTVVNWKELFKEDVEIQLYGEE